MPSFWDRINPIGKHSYVNPIANKGFRKQVGNFLTGTPEIRENVSTLLPQQEPLLGNAVNAAQQRGAGGAFGDVADYYRGNLSDNPADFNAFAAPALRQYNQDIVPGLSEQFAGMGAGGLSSSGFRNAQIQGATDLSERLGALRASLRQQAAQGLQGIGEVGLRNYSTRETTQPGSEGFLSALAPAIGTAAGALVGGVPGAAAGGAAGNAFGQWFGGRGTRVGANTSPYGQSPRASPIVGQVVNQAGLQSPYGRGY